MQFVVERNIFGISTIGVGWILIAFALTGLSILAVYYILHDIWINEISRACDDEDELEATETI